MDALTQQTQMAASQVLAFHNRFQLNYLHTVRKNYEQICSEGLFGPVLVAWHEQLAIGCIALYAVSGHAIRSSIVDLVQCWVDFGVIPSTTKGAVTKLSEPDAATMMAATERVMRSLEKAIRSNVITGRALVDISAAYVSTGETGIEDQEVHALFTMWRQWQLSTKKAMMLQQSDAGASDAA